MKVCSVEGCGNAAIEALAESDGDGWPVRAYEIKANAITTLGEYGETNP